MNRFIHNNYYAIYMPTHNRNMSNRCVYEHILIAEDILGRPLKKEECVHHENGNKLDNSKENIAVFKSVSDHTAYHNGLKRIMRKDGVYEVPSKSINGKNLCPICNKNYKDVSSSMYKACRLKIVEQESNRIDKNILLEELNKYKNFTSVAKIHGVTDNAVRKWCKYYGIPFHTSDYK